MTARKWRKKREKAGSAFPQTCAEQDALPICGSGVHLVVLFRKTDALAESTPHETALIEI